MIQIFATDESGYRQEITDLYWFEEEGVHTFDGYGAHERYLIEIFVDGKRVYPKAVGTFSGVDILVSDSIPEDQVALMADGHIIKIINLEKKDG